MRAQSGQAPFGIQVGAGAALMVSAAAAGALLFADRDAAGRLIVVAVAAGGYAALVADTRAALITAGLGYLLFDGFLVNRFGDLTWDGTTSLWHLTVLTLVVGLGLGRRWIRHAGTDMDVDEELNKIIENKKESHRG